MSVYELNRFRRYMYSPYFNEDEKLRRFTDAVLPFLKNKNLSDAHEVPLWKAVYGKERYNRPRFVRLLSDIVKRLEQFLVVDRFQQNTILQHAYLLEIMNERKLSKHFAELLSLTEKRHRSAPLRDGQFYYHELLIQEQKNLYLENRDQRSAEKNLSEVMDSLDVHFVINKLKYGAAMLHYKNFLQIETNDGWLQQVLALAPTGKYNLPAIHIYRNIILSFTQPNNEEHYRKLNSLLQQHYPLFTVAELKTLFVFAMNYCINRINLGHSQYLNELLQVYQLALKNDLLLEAGMLSPWDYKNIVTVALRVKKYAWAKEFIDEYKPRLPKTERQNAYTFNLARFYFYTREYDRVLQLLQDVKYNDIFYQLDSKTTLLKTYYEKGEELPLLSLKDSFRILLKRKKLITPQQQQNYMNLLNYTLRLFKADVRNTKALASLRAEIEATENIADKGWLLEKADELTA